ncbi:MAG: DMT family transporter [Paludibacteraceae bacterium]|nr:DMT family transporter [Paludibacteraceae bacterium]
MKDKKLLTGHGCMLGASIMWGLMAPLGKDAMTHGISGLEMICFRVTGASVCFWLASFLTSVSEKTGTEEKISKKDHLQLLGAALFAIVFNQCNYIIGLSITSPLNASIMTTTMPIFTMVLAFLFLREPITLLKAGGVILGACGAATLILASANGDIGGGKLKGDLMCIAAQCSYAIYLTAFKGVIQKFSATTCMKWMMTYASLIIVPFALPQLLETNWNTVSSKTWAETAFVVIGGTFFAFLLSITAQKVLRPTIVAMYNYVQPIVSCTVSVLLGIGLLGWSHPLAILLVFTGVYMVNRSKAKDA